VELTCISCPAEEIAIYAQAVNQGLTLSLFIAPISSVEHIALPFLLFREVR
jgi:hypothetical protein